MDDLVHEKREQVNAVEMRQPVDITELRRLLGGAGNQPISEVFVGKLVRQGLPKRRRGVYDPVACLHWYVGALRRSRHAPGWLTGTEIAE